MTTTQQERAREFWLKFAQEQPYPFGNETLNRKRGDWVMLNPEEAAFTLAAYSASESERADRQWREWGVVEVAVRNPQVADYCQHWEGRTEAAEKRADEAERQLAEALKFAEQIEMHCPCGARPESLDKRDRYGNIYSHTGGCPVEKLLKVLRERGERE
jgi:hypothetical protein